MNPHALLAASMRALHENRVERALAGFPAPTPAEVERDRITRAMEASIRLFEHGPLLTRPRKRLAAATLRKDA